MAGKLFKGSRFLADYVEIVTGLSAANSDVSVRFCDAVEQALTLLVEYPELGAKAGFRHAPQVRKWVVRSFHNYILFYAVRPDGILAIRLLHGARHLPPLIPGE